MGSHLELLGLNVEDPLTESAARLVYDGIFGSDLPTGEGSLDVVVAGMTDGGQIYYGLADESEGLQAVGGLIVPDVSGGAYLDILVVDHRLRGRGVGSFVLRQLEALVAEVHDFSALRVTPLSDVREFYMGHGYKPYLGGGGDLIRNL